MSGRPDYVRVWSDADGESHFEDVYLDHEPQGAGGRAARVAVSELLEVDGLAFRRVLADASSSEPHNAPEPLFIVNLVGEVEVEVSDGETRRFGPGDVTLVEDLDGKGHITRPLSRGERMTLIAPLSARSPGPRAPRGSPGT